MSPTPDVLSAVMPASRGGGRCGCSETPGSAGPAVWPGGHVHGFKRVLEQREVDVQVIYFREEKAPDLSAAGHLDPLGSSGPFTSRWPRLAGIWEPLWGLFPQRGPDTG